MSQHPRTGTVVVILGGTLREAKYWKRRLADEYPGLDKAREVTVNSRGLEGLCITRAYIAPGAYFFEGYDRALAVIGRSLAKLQKWDADERPIYLEGK